LVGETTPLAAILALKEHQMKHSMTDFSVKFTPVFLPEMRVDLNQGTGKAHVYVGDSDDTTIDVVREEAMELLAFLDLAESERARLRPRE